MNDEFNDKKKNIIKDDWSVFYNERLDPTPRNVVSYI